MSKEERESIYIRGRVVVNVTRSNTEICEIVDLKINGVPAFIFDFGKSVDLAPEKATACGCGDRTFVPNPKAFTPSVMARYGLRPQDKRDLIWIFKNKFHIGYCKRCR